MDDSDALKSYDDLAEHGYGERDERRAELEATEGWRDDPAPENPVSPYAGAILCLKDALSYLEEPDPEAALQSIREATVRIGAAL